MKCLSSNTTVNCTGKAEFRQSSSPFVHEVLNLALWFKVSVRGVPSPSPTGTRHHFCRRRPCTRRRPGRRPPRRARSTGRPPMPRSPALGPPGSLCTTNNRLTCDGDDKIQYFTHLQGCRSAGHGCTDVKMEGIFLICHLMGRIIRTRCDGGWHAVYNMACKTARLNPRTSRRFCR